MYLMRSYVLSDCMKIRVIYPFWTHHFWSLMFALDWLM